MANRKYDWEQYLTEYLKSSVNDAKLFLQIKLGASPVAVNGGWLLKKAREFQKIKDGKLPDKPLKVLPPEKKNKRVSTYTPRNNPQVEPFEVGIKKLESLKAGIFYLVNKKLNNEIKRAQENKSPQLTTKELMQLLKAVRTELGQPDSYTASVHAHAGMVPGKEEEYDQVLSEEILTFMAGLRNSTS